MLYIDVPLTVRYAETDRMGIVHHSNYPVWFEVGRTEFIKQCGISYSRVESKGIMLPLLEVHCKFISSSTYEDKIIVRTSIKSFSKTRLNFKYEVFKSDNMDNPITRGETSHVWTTCDLKPINLQKHYPELYEIIEKSARDV
ncbi:thioesterase superfamily protein [Ruminiclostridium papyrosolvens DSM 2782]|uniref:Thioesterase superfamily protein n=1 Tax=Ruminiclostridium papyrosolvens DSM 2782 TaxID=588581 RepID=F1T9P5_9FIRM|nr:thioesterase family protein [Ruminiclostridium papyrosolvens]EGD49227.1 thioesterase superfamily protein [Ruminiclostridium papyrosolvens DSM 2782]WES35704.1 thioesterase family protein [Ruminiclostridium papyrosolvens DSM 2782]